MRIQDLLVNEMRRGRVGPNVTTIDPNSPMMSKQIQLRKKRTQNIDSAPTVKDKFEIVYKYDQKGLKFKVRLMIPGNSRLGTNDIIGYDPATGNIVLSPLINAHLKEITKIHYNIDDFEFKGRQQQNIAAPFYYYFGAVNEPSNVEHNIPNPRYNPELAKNHSQNLKDRHAVRQAELDKIKPTTFESS